MSRCVALTPLFTVVVSFTVKPDYFLTLLVVVFNTFRKIASLSTPLGIVVTIQIITLNDFLFLVLIKDFYFMFFRIFKNPSSSLSFTNSYKPCKSNNGFKRIFLFVKNCISISSTDTRISA